MLKLSIQNLTASEELAAYYEEEAERPEASATIESYYAHAAPARILTITPDGITAATPRTGDIARLLSGHDTDGRPIARNVNQPNRRAGTDFTMSADKSFSALKRAARLAGDGALVRGMDAALERATDAVLQHSINLGLVKTRHGRGGLDQRPAPFIHAFDVAHDISRAGDPNDHRHKVQINASEADGKPCAVDAAGMVEHKFFLEAVGSSVLAREIRALGIAVEEIGKEGHGRLRIAGVPEKIVATWSKRRAQLLQARDRIDVVRIAQESEHERQAAEGEDHSPHDAPSGDTRRRREAMNRHATRTRTRKDELPSADALAARHLAEVDAAGTTPDGIIRSVRAANLTTPLPDRNVGAFARSRLFEKDAVASERAIRTAVAEAGAVFGLSPEETEEEVSTLKSGLAYLGDHDGKGYYTTAEMMALERGLLRAVYDGQGRGVLSPESVEAAITELATRAENPVYLSAEQRNSAYQVARGDAVCAVRSPAGAGETTVMDAIRMAARIQGLRVMALAPANRTATGLQAEIVTDERVTVQKLRMLLEGGRDLDIGRHSLLFIDEAAMAEMRDAATIIAEVRRRGGTVVMVGDELQFAAIGAGAPFRLVKAEIGAAELENIRRQRVEEMRVASMTMAAGDSHAGLLAYDSMGRVTVAADRSSAMERIVRDYAAHLREKPAASRMVIAWANADVHDLNARLRAAERTVGNIRGGEITLTTLHRGGQEGRGQLRVMQVAEGDRLLVWANLKDLGLNNGDRLTVERIVPGETEARHRLVVRTERGRQLTLTKDDLIPPRRDEEDEDRVHAPRLQHAYAVSAYSAKGATVDEAWVYGAGGMDRVTTYVAMTRHLDGVRLTYDCATAREALIGMGVTPTSTAVRDHLLSRSKRDATKLCCSDFIADKRAWAYEGTVTLQSDASAPSPASRAERMMTMAETQERRVTAENLREASSPAGTRSAGARERAEATTRPGEVERQEAAAERMAARRVRTSDAPVRERAGGAAGETREAVPNAAPPPPRRDSLDAGARRVREGDLVDRAYARIAAREKARVEAENARLRGAMLREMAAAATPSLLRRIGWDLQRLPRAVMSRGDPSGGRRAWHARKLEAFAASRAPAVLAVGERYRGAWLSYVPPDRTAVAHLVGDGRAMEFFGRAAEIRKTREAAEELRNRRLLPHRQPVAGAMPELLTSQDLAILRRIGGERAIDALRLRGLEREGEGTVAMRVADYCTVLRLEQRAEEARVIAGVSRHEGKPEQQVRAWLDDQVAHRRDPSAIPNRQLGDAVARIQALRAHEERIQEAVRGGTLPADSTIRARDPHGMTAAERREHLAAGASASRLTATLPAKLFGGRHHPAGDVAAYLRVLRRLLGPGSETGQAAPGSPAAVLDRALLLLRAEGREDRITRSTPLRLAMPSSSTWREAILAARSAVVARTGGRIPSPDPSATLRSLAARDIAKEQDAMSDRSRAAPEAVPVPAQPAPQQPKGSPRRASRLSNPTR